jgi:hypothetical protein
MIELAGCSSAGAVLGYLLLALAMGWRPGS